MATKQEVTQYGVLITPSSSWSNNGKDRCTEIMSDLSTMENYDKRDESELFVISKEIKCDFCDNDYETEADGYPVCCSQAQKEYALLHPELDCSELSGDGEICEYKYHYYDCGPSKVVCIARRKSADPTKIEKPLVEFSIARSPAITHEVVRKMIICAVALIGNGDSNDPADRV